MKLLTKIGTLGLMLFFSLPLLAQEEEMGLHQTLRDKFLEGGNAFMSDCCRPRHWPGVLH